MLNFVKMFQSLHRPGIEPGSLKDHRSTTYIIKRIAQRKWLPVKPTWKSQFLNQAQSNGFSTYSLVIDDFDIYNIQTL